MHAPKHHLRQNIKQNTARLHVSWPTYQTSLSLKFRLNIFLPVTKKKSVNHENLNNKKN